MSDAKPFIHLHMHTSYSLLDSTVRVKPVVKHAAKLGMSALALTDHNVMHGAIDFYNACLASDIKPIIGSEMNVCRDHTVKTRSEAGPNDHLLLLATNEKGYHNLARLGSIAHLEGFYYRPRVDMELLARHAEGLIATSSCMRGAIPRAILDGNEALAEQLIGQHVDIFGKENFFLELEDHGLESEKRVNRALIEFSKKMGLPLVATNDVHYMKQQDAEAHEVLLCMQSQAVMADERRIKFEGNQYHFRTAEEMWDLFGNEAPEALYNTVEIADRCNLKLFLNDEAPLHFPSYDVPDDHDHESYLTELTVEGIKKLYNGADITNPVSEEELILKERFDKELGIIKKTGYVNYFLVVWDFVAYAQRTDVPVGPGRGSGAGSLVAYAMGITAIDPLRFNLFFERFLNPERVSPPDFDIDFCQQRRGQVIDYVKDKYGQENCAQIITFGTLGAKTIIRDIGRVLQIDLKECDRLAKMIPEDPGMTISKAEEANPEFKQALQTDPFAKQIMKFGRTLEGLHRNQGTHAAGVVIGEHLLMDIIPLCKDKENQPVAQFEMKPLEMTGLLKMDFLGLKTLTVVKEAVDNVKEIYDIQLDPGTFSLDDEKTYELLGRGDTVGVFQVESKGMRDLLRQFQADRIEDVIALIALYRPGPMDMIPDYVKRKQGLAEFEYPHPKLDTVLKETYGIFIYQEQVQQASNVLAGFSLAEGDLLRRAMGKKDANIMAAMREKFAEGCKEVSDISAKQSGEIFDTIEKFASYGFNKSHSAAYAMVTWQTAFLKAHYPPEFMAALLSNEIGNSEKLTFFIAECQEMGMEVLPPSVQQSRERFSSEDGNIRFGLAGAKGVGSAAVESLVNERKENGPFKSFMDFCMRINHKDMNKKSVESMVKCGAFDWTGLHRARIFNAIDFAMQRAESTLADRETGQISMFDMLAGGAEESSASDDDLPECPPWSLGEMLAYEKDLVGFYISGHPLEEHEWDLKHYATHDVSSLSDEDLNKPVRLGGLITDYRKVFTKRTQEPMGIFRLEGLNGGIDTVMFSQAFQRHGAALANETTVMAAGVYKRKESDVQLEVHEVVPLKSAGKTYGRQVYLHLTHGQADEGRIDLLKQVCMDHKGSTPLIFCVEFPDGQRIYLDTANSFHVEANTRFVRAVEQVIGENRVFVLALETVYKNPPEKRSFGKRRD